MRGFGGPPPGEGTPGDPEGRGCDFAARMILRLPGSHAGTSYRSLSRSGFGRRAVHEGPFNGQMILAGEYDVAAFENDNRFRGLPLGAIDQSALLFRFVSYTPRDQRLRRDYGQHSVYSVRYHVISMT